MRLAETFRTNKNICLATTAAWDRFPTQQFSWLAREATKRYADIEFSEEWLAFVPAPRTLSREAESTIESNIQTNRSGASAMPCYAREAPKRYADTKFSEEWLTFVPAPRTLSPEAESTIDSVIQSVVTPILRVSHAVLCEEAPNAARPCA